MNGTGDPEDKLVNSCATCFYAWQVRSAWICDHPKEYYMTRYAKQIYSTGSTLITDCKGWREGIPFIKPEETPNATISHQKATSSENTTKLFKL